MCVCIQTGDIVWINGPWPAGSGSEIGIFRQSLRQQLLPGEMVEADSGYRGEQQFIRRKNDYVSRSDRRAKKRARARHETVFGRMKMYDILTNVFRHDGSKHQTVFFSVAVVTQLSFDNGEGPFQCRY